MKAIVLAAGVGSRLRPITNKKPKALVEINGKPILHYTLEALYNNEIKDVIMCLGYKATDIISFCERNFPQINFIFVENKDYEETNNMYSLYLAREHFDEDVFLMNADVVFDSEIITGMKKMKESCVGVDVGKYMEESMKVKVKQGKITGISKTIDSLESYGSSIDVYKFREQDLKEIKLELETIIEKKQIRDQWTEVMLDSLFKQGKVLATVYDIKGNKWYEVDNFVDLAQAEMLFNTKISTLKNKKVFFIDLDGTLKLGDQVIDGSIDFLEMLQRKKKKFFLFTNNSSRTAKQYQEKFSQLGLSVDIENVLVSLQPAITYFRQNKIRKIYYVANENVSRYLLKQGFIFEDKSPDAVLLTYDDQVTYDKLKSCSSLVRKGIPYYATHSDVVCPTPDGDIPDIGTFIKLIEMTTGIVPNMVFGKPNKNFLLPILKDLKISPDDAVIVGDRLYTDIILGKNSNICSVLVLSGETKREGYEDSDVRADVIVPNIKELIGYL